jgi:hypothetical protein
LYTWSVERPCISVLVENIVFEDLYFDIVSVCRMVMAHHGTSTY